MTTRKGENITRWRNQRKVTTTQFFAAHPVFSLDEANQALRPASGRTAAVQRLKHHLASGRLKLITRGVYAVVPPGSAAGKFEPDTFLVAQTARPDAVFSHHAALELLGVAYSEWTTCTAFSAGRRRTIKMARASIGFLQHPTPMVAHPLFGTRRVERLGRLLVATGPERTLVESFRRPALAGGLGELLESARAFPVLDLDLLAEMLRRYDLSILWASTGWFLEKHSRTFHVSGQVLASFESHRPKSPQYIARSLRGGTLLPRWNLIVPEPLLGRGEPDDTGA